MPNTSERHFWFLGQTGHASRKLLDAASSCHRTSPNATRRHCQRSSDGPSLDFSIYGSPGADPQGYQWPTCIEDNKILVSSFVHYNFSTRIFYVERILHFFYEKNMGREFLHGEERVGGDDAKSRHFTSKVSHVCFCTMKRQALQPPRACCVYIRYYYNKVIIWKLCVTCPSSCVESYQRSLWRRNVCWVLKNFLCPSYSLSSTS